MPRPVPALKFSRFLIVSGMTLCHFKIIISVGAKQLSIALFLAATLSVDKCINIGSRIIVV